MRVALLLALLVVPSASGAANLTLACLNAGQSVEVCREVAAEFAEREGHTVRVVSADQRDRSALNDYRALLDLKSPRLDVIQFPDTWAPALRDDLMTLDVPFDPKEHVPASVVSALDGARHVALPHFIAIPLLYVRADLFGASPTRWMDLRDALIEARADEAGQVTFAGEGTALFPFVLDWLMSFAVDGFEDKAGLVAALAAMNDAVGTFASPEVVTKTSQEAIASFSDGSSAALIARSTAIEAFGPPQEAVSATMRPSLGGQDVPVLATTFYVGVSRYTLNKDAAMALAAALTSAEAQRASAERALAPTRLELYGPDGPQDVVTRLIAQRIGALQPAPVARFGVAYLSLADEISEAVRNMLRGEISVEDTVLEIQRAVRRAELSGG